MKCALPDRPVRAASPATAASTTTSPSSRRRARYGINAVMVVNNNRALNQEITLKRDYDGKQRGRADELWRFSEFNFAKVAEAIGCAGIRVEKPGEIDGALKGPSRWTGRWSSKS